MIEVKLPKAFSEFYDSTMAVLRKNREQRTSEAIKKTMASDERVLLLQDAVAKGREAKKFLEGDFWLDHLEPYFRGECVLKPAVLKDGEPAPLDRINVAFLIGSGQVNVITKLLAKLEQWQTDGHEAEKILTLEAEKRRALREAQEAP